jgi:cysteine desulfurase
VCDCESSAERPVTTRIYLDWNAGAPLLPEVCQVLEDELDDTIGNPSSVHAEGRRGRDLVERARGEVAALAGAAPAGVVFSSSGSEANTMALRGLLVRCRGAGKRGLALPGTEHPSVLATAEQLRGDGVTISRAPVDADGVVIRERLAELLASGDIGVVCTQLANSETGVIQPVRALAALAHAHGALIHCDAVQAAGKLPIDMAALGGDSLSLSAHKLGGLPGSGALVLRSGVEIEALIPGTQERHRRGGTENVLGIVAFGVAARLARERIPAWQAVSGRRDLLEEDVLERIAGSSVYGRAVARLSNTSALALPVPLRGGVMVAALDLAGFAVSSGSACSAGVERGSTVVEAMGYGKAAAQRTLRVSLGPATGEREVRAFVAALAGAAERRKGGRP